MHVIRESVNADLTYDTNVRMHPWIEPFIIRVSSGLGLIVNNFLSDIEDVFATDKPDIEYLRITEELFGEGDETDVSALYQRKLRIFIQAGKQIEARDFAINYCVNNAVELSLRYCYICSHELVKLNIKDKEVRKDAPFLPVAPKGMMGYTHVCLSCAYDAWESDQDAINSEIVDVHEAESMRVEQFDKKSGLKPVSDYEAESLSNDDNQEMDGIHAEQKRAKLNAPPPGTVILFDLKEVDDLLENNTVTSRDQVARIKGVVQKIKKISHFKKLVPIPEKWSRYCDDLERRFPNFHDYILHLRNQFALAARGDRVLSLPPTLFVGGPGIGKSELCLSIANELGTILRVVDMSTAQTGSPLTGSEAYWSNTTPGQIFSILTMDESCIANPIFILDELDKVRARGDQDPLSGLHGLLEPRQAKRWQDLSIPEIVLNTSHIMYVATANSIETIPGPILDRFTVFKIADPDHSQMLSIVGTQYKRFLDTHSAGKSFKRTISKKVREELANHHPRKVRRLLEQAFGLAAQANRDYLTVKDIQDVDTGKKRNCGIGFMSPV
jgi:histone H3/H4